MLEVVWTRRAEDHVQRIFARLDEYSPRIAESWLEEIGKRAELLARFPRSRPSGVATIDAQSSAAALVYSM
jgi:plasmid stabilization system protein ParE